MYALRNALSFVWILTCAAIATQLSIATTTKFAERFNPVACCASREQVDKIAHLKKDSKSIKLRRALLDKPESQSAPHHYTSISTSRELPGYSIVVFITASIGNTTFNGETTI